MKPELYHLKMSTGDDLICEIVDWNDNTGEIEARDVYTLKPIVSSGGSSYYTFRPFLIYQDTPGQNLFINPEHIVAHSIPDDRIINQYHRVLAVLAESDEADPDPEEEADLMEKLREYMANNDSADGVVVTFPNKDKDKMH